MFGVSQRSGFGILGALVLADIGVIQNIQPFGVGRHDAIFDSVMHHFDEMARARRSAMQITLLGGALGFFAARSSRDVADSRGERFLERGGGPRPLLFFFTPS